MTMLTRIAHQVLLEHWDSYLPVNVVSIAQKLGTQVIFDDTLPEDISGKFERVEGKPVITVNANQHPNRQRFTVAHELGHYLLGHGDSLDSPTALFRQTGQLSEIETQANQFAAELLMPKPVLDEYITNNDIHSINALGKVFGVSGQAMLIRLQNTGWQ